MVKSIEVVDLPKEVVSLDVYPKAGDKVTAFRNAYDRIGTMIIKGVGLQQLFSISNKVIGTSIKITVV